MRRISSLRLFLAARALRDHRPNRTAGIIILSLPVAFLLVFTLNSIEGHQALRDSYDKKISIHDPAVQLNRGRFWFKEGDNARAKQSYEMIVREFPNYQGIGEAYYRLAFIAFDQQDYPTAIATATKGMEVIKPRRNVWNCDNWLKQLSIILQASRCYSHQPSC